MPKYFISTKLTNRLLEHKNTNLEIVRFSFFFSMSKSYEISKIKGLSNKQFLAHN